jgi:transposase
LGEVGNALISKKKTPEQVVSIERPHLVSGIWLFWCMLVGLRGGRRPPAPSPGRRRPPHLRPQPQVSFGTTAVVTHDRTVARSSIARTRQVTVANIICGVDVSSEMLDARIGMQGAFERFASTPEGVEALAAFCRKHGVELVAMEATGGYEKRPFALLWAQGIPVAIANPRSVRRFAEAMGLLEKTDKIDAGVIAWFAQVKRIKPREPASETQGRLAALVLRLRQLTDLRTAQTNQRRLVSEPTVQEAFDELLALITRQIRSLEPKIAGLIDDDPLWQKLDEACREIKGVADRTVARLMADLPELGVVSNKAIGKLVGFAPLADDSGNHSGKRAVRGGRGSIRSILFVVAEVVRRHEPDFTAFHKRLSEAGKPKKVIRTALAHKLLTRLNAKARDVRKEFQCAT